MPKINCQRNVNMIYQLINTQRKTWNVKKNNEKSESVRVRKQFKTHGKFLKPSSYYKGNNLQHSVVNNYETQSRNSRAVALSTHVCLRMRREREPSRISFKIVTKLFKRKRKRKAVEFYLNKCIPTSSVIKVMLSGYIRNQFFDRCRRWETVINLPPKSIYKIWF